MNRNTDTTVAWIKKIPVETRRALQAYRDHGDRPGGFVSAVLENDAHKAILSADTRNYAALREIVWFVRRFLPSESFGDSVKFEQWIYYDGLNKFDDDQKVIWYNRRLANLRELGIEDEVEL